MHYIKIITQDQRVCIGELMEFEGELMIVNVNHPEKFNVGHTLSCIYNEFTFNSKVLKTKENFIYIHAPLLKNNLSCERRKYPRVGVTINGYINNCINETIFELPPDQHVGITNIAIEGFGFEADYLLKKSFPYILHVELNNKMIVKPRILITNITELDTGYRFGCQINKISDEDNRILRFFILSQQLNK